MPSPRALPLPPAALATLVLTALLAAAPAARAALQNPPKEDVEWLLEHLPEAAMDERFTALPLTAGRLETGRWQTALTAAWAGNDGGLATLDGGLVAAGFTRGLSERWGVEVMAAYDRLSFGGNGGGEVLHPGFRDDFPLDLPERADFSNPRGSYESAAVGLAAVRQWAKAARPERYWTLSAGVLAQRVSLDGYAIDYRLAGGADEGTAGTLDHSADYTFVSPFVALQKELPVGGSGGRFTLRPRAVAAFPLPRQSFAGRLTGPGFDLAGPGHGKHVGDPTLSLGLEVEHRASGLALDVGAAVAQPLIERVTHEGLDQAWLVALSWRH